MNKGRFKVILEGADEGYVRVPDFVSTLRGISSAITAVEQIVTSHEEVSPIVLRVVALSMASPSTIEFEVVDLNAKQEHATHAQDIVHTFLDGWERINRGHIPDNFDSQILETFRQVSLTLTRSVSRMIFVNGKHEIQLRKTLPEDITRLIGDDETEDGSIEGMLDAINLHDTARQFWIYPRIGPRKVKCIFPDSLTEKAKAGLEHHVNVIGQLRCKKADKFPYAINVQDMEIYPDDKNLPTMFDLRGMAPDATGKMTSEEFIRKIRDAQK